MKSNELKTSESESRAAANFRSKNGSTSYQTIQPKLTVNQPSDVYEEEADRLAVQVMSAPESIIESRRSARMPEFLTLVQRRDNNNKGIQLQDDSFEEQLSASKGGGKPLSEDVRLFMEPRFGADFSNVQIHENSEADQMNQMISAHAFTHHQDIYFGAGNYNPDSNEGKGLLAHELTHVVQQTGAQSNKQVSSPANTSVSTVSGNPIQRSFLSSIGSLFGGGSGSSGPAPAEDPLGGLLGGIGSAIGGIGAMGSSVQSGNPASIISSALGMGSGLLGTANQLSGGALGPLGAMSGVLGAGQSAVNSFSQGNIMEGGMSALGGLGQGLGALGLGGFEMPGAGATEAGGAEAGAPCTCEAAAPGGAESPAAASLVESLLGSAAPALGGLGGILGEGLGFLGL
ncbi:MAG: DUF4157 domain-containing protein [Chitinophagaceae bacterium]